MALNTYATLKTAVASFLNRSDLAASITDFVTLAEAQMNRRLRVREMVGRSTASLTDEFLAVPGDFLGTRTVTIATDPTAILRYVSPDEAERLKATVYTATGTPKVYTVLGDEFQFLPAPDDTYTVNMTYWKAIPALSDNNTSNWVLAAHPDAYLYGALLQSAPFLGTDERIAVWGRMFMEIISDMMKEDAHNSYGGTLNMRPKTFG